MPALLQKVGATQQEAHALIEVDWSGKELTADDASVIAWMLRNGKLATATSLKYLPLRLNLLENCRGHDLEPAPECLLLCQRPLTLCAPCPWQCRWSRASDRRAQGHEADREDRPLAQGARRRVRHHHRELHQGEWRAQGAQVRRPPQERLLLCQRPLTLLISHRPAPCLQFGLQQPHQRRQRHVRPAQARGNPPADEDRKPQVRRHRPSVCFCVNAR